jgi:hypothetical protein
MIAIARGHNTMRRSSPGFRAVLIDPADARLGDTQDAALAVIVAGYEGNLLGGPQAGEKAQLIVVTWGFAPVTV